MEQVNKEDDEDEEQEGEDTEEKTSMVASQTSTASDSRSKKSKRSENFRRTKIQERTNSSGKAYAMAKSRASRKIRHVLEGLGSVKDQSEALQAALDHTSMKVLSRKVGRHKTARDCSAIDFQQFQIKTMLTRATSTQSAHGRTNNDQSLFVNNVLLSVAPSPPESPEKEYQRYIPSLHAQAKATGLPMSTATRKLAAAAEK